MTVTRHYVTDAGGAAWKGEDATVPGAKGCREDTAYSSGEKTAVSDANAGTYVEISGAGVMAGHEYDVPVSESGITQFDVVASAGNGDFDDHKLYVYNFNSAAYALLDTDGGPAPFTLSGALTSDLGYYVDSGKMRVQVVGGAGPSMIVRCYEVYVDVTWSAIELSPANLAQSQALEVGTISQLHVLSPADLSQGQSLATTGAGAAFSPAALSQAHSLEAATLQDIVQTLSPANLAQAQALEVGAISQLHVLSPADLAHAHALEAAPDLVVAHIEVNPANLAQAHALEVATITVNHVLSPADLLQTHALQAGAIYPEVHLHLALLADGTRRLSWTDTGHVYLIVDGAVYAETSDGYLDLPDTFEARGILIGYTEMPDPLPTPRDLVDLTWTGDTDATYDVDRQPDGGAWADIADVLGFAYQDGPLADGLYHYRVTATDEEGDTAVSATADATIDACPDAPSGIDYDWDVETQTLTVSWDASESADVATYPVRSNAGSGMLDLTSAPVQDTAATTYELVFTTETGEYLFAVRAKDSDGFEEPGLTQILTVSVVDGLVVRFPVEPSLVYAESVGEGRIEVGFLYRPWREGANPGAAHEARIYGDGGTGTMDYTHPLAIIPMANPTVETWYSWTTPADPGSEPLFVLDMPGRALSAAELPPVLGTIGGASALSALTSETEYLFVVRIATAAWPGGVETQNTDAVAATPNTDVPTTPVLEAEVV